MDDTLAMCRTIRKLDRRMTPISFGNSEKWKAVHYISTFNQKFAGEDIVNRDYALTTVTWPVSCNG